MTDAILTEQRHQDLILSHLSPEDDTEFWSIAISILLHDIEVEIEKAHRKTEVYTQVGACSHWLRPHQTRWTAAGGFAWPSGYGASGYTYSRLGLPEFDWFVLLRRDFESQSWHPVEKVTGKRHSVIRVTLPTRTKRHPQAAVHTIWLPACPSTGKPKATHIYGFRKIEGIWQCVADI